MKSGAHADSLTVYTGRALSGTKIQTIIICVYEMIVGDSLRKKILKFRVILILNSKKCKNKLIFFLYAEIINQKSLWTGGLMSFLKEMYDYTCKLST